MRTHLEIGRAFEETGVRDDGGGYKPVEGEVERVARCVRVI